MVNPYERFPSRAFWRTAISTRDALTILDLWDPKHSILPEYKIATAGSCFAQHISRALLARRYRWFDAERPMEALDAAQRQRRNYGIFSARTGNIYTAAALRQWIHWALGKEIPPDEIWEQNGRYFDPFRPTIEPNGFSSPAELVASRSVTLQALRRVVARSHVFIFTMGLTEGWINSSGGYVYPMCPGTAAGAYDETNHAFKNYSFNEILRDMDTAIASMKAINRQMRIILTVSPVPLTATASGKHVLPATTYSKSVLRAVAGQLADTYDYIDYFPSYEIITGAPFRSMFYEPNLRSVTAEGVEFVMNSFFSCLYGKFDGIRPAAASPPVRQALDNPKAASPRKRPAPHEGRGRARRDSDVVCEEQMLAAFAPQAPAQELRGTETARICVIGNSHLAALRMALADGLFDDARIAFTFWGFIEPSFNNIRYQNGLLAPPEEGQALKMQGMQIEIDPNGYDALLFVGSGINTTTMFSRLRRTNPDLRGCPDDILRRRLDRWIRDDPLMILASSVAAACRGKIAWVPRPLVSEDYGKFKELVITDDEFNLLNRLYAEAMISKKLIYVPQPPDTIVANKWTKKEYTLAFSNLGTWGRPRPTHRGPHQGAYLHMLPRYGEKVLLAVRNALRDVL